MFAAVETVTRAQAFGFILVPLEGVRLKNDLKGAMKRSFSRGECLVVAVSFLFQSEKDQSSAPFCSKMGRSESLCLRSPRFRWYSLREAKEIAPEHWCVF